ncbi:MAG TPA: hypothetical protein VGX68_13995 [Thermoanaerobaculia bacterium]|jgi:hypothetical protein|nr:hypothetical protein [Thermoanaerobaculia bacterium]
MPQIKAHADLFRHWQGVIGACERNADILAGIEPLLADLKDFLEEATEVKLEQEHHGAQRKAQTQSFNEVTDRGKEAVRKVQAFVLTRLDSRDERLSEFGIKVNRTRRKKVEPPKPPVVEVKAPSQETAAAPAPAEETTKTPAPGTAAE